MNEIANNVTGENNIPDIIILMFSGSVLMTWGKNEKEIEQYLQ
jgi:hypothetical protein